ncbi:hypothetical protein ACFQ8C_19380 [Streptomyces sp. NPDC056503]|uniref:hypothetical protein n=1 Tax=Streptomyces sp. NPDC056503 TaxID=3345842 RepID=UPI0036845FF8
MTKSDDLSKELAEFKDSLLKKTEELKYQVPNPNKGEAEKTPFVETTVKEVGSELKRHLINDAPMITTENFIRSFFAEALKQIKEIHTEATKNPWTEFMEATPLGAFAPALEKFFESREDKEVQWWQWLLAAIVGGVLLALLPAIKSSVVNLARDLQTYERGGDNSKEARALRTIRSKNADGGWSRQLRGDVEAREKRQWEGASSIADIPATANFDGLRGQLANLNPHLEKFNSHAPDFKANLRGMPSLSKATKIADAVKKLDEVVDTTRTPLIAKALGKINEAVTYSDPKKTTELAKAVGKLKLAMKDFKADEVPTAAALGPAAQKAEELARHTTTLTGNMRGFADAVRELNSQMNPA